MFQICDVGARLRIGSVSRQVKALAFPSQPADIATESARFGRIPHDDLDDISQTTKGEGADRAGRRRRWRSSRTRRRTAAHTTGLTRLQGQQSARREDHGEGRGHSERDERPDQQKDPGWCSRSCRRHGRIDAVTNVRFRNSVCPPAVAEPGQLVILKNANCSHVETC